ncbi:MAG: IS3 family transposase [Ignavibacteria bacterium]|nr:IS3 family transposase [Ignavibacteria bacterium]
MHRICEIVGISPQGYYKSRRQKQFKLIQEDIILKFVQDIRIKLPILGGKKLFKILDPEFKAMGIKLGRDKFFEILRRNGQLIHRKKRYMKTTYSSHRFTTYDNHIKDIEPTMPDEILVSDITYISTEEGFGFLALSTDLFSRKIVGHDFSNSLNLEGSIRALKMAIAGKENLSGMIHHSDRGIQYCSNLYTGILIKNQIRISMSEKGNPYENAVAERVNGILKEEFMLGQKFKTMSEAKKAIKEAIKSYNELRLHMSINYMTPNQKYAA